MPLLLSSRPNGRLTTSPPHALAARRDRPQGELKTGEVEAEAELLDCLDTIHRQQHDGAALRRFGRGKAHVPIECIANEIPLLVNGRIAKQSECRG